MNRKKSSKKQKVAGKKPKGKGPVIFEDGPIIIKGGSVSIRYLRSSFRPRGDFNDHKDNGTPNQMIIGKVTILNDDTGAVIYEGFPGPHCSIYVNYG